MPPATLGLFALVLVALVLIALVLLQPQLGAARGGKILILIAFLILPALATALGTSTHLETSKSTEFCLSCHIMSPYGETLWIDDQDYLPAAHFQNNRIPRQQACYTCHTTYTMFGDVRAKMTGMKHLWIHYLGTAPEQLELYAPFQNRECLHCHQGGRSYLELHADFDDELRTNETSCLDCHDLVHPIEELPKLERWARTPVSASPEARRGDSP